MNSISRRERLKRVSTRSLSRSHEHTLRILDWGYVHESAVLERFERRHDVVVEVETAANSASVIERMAREPVPDLVALGNYAVPQAIDQGLLQPLDVDRIDAYDTVFDGLKRDYFDRNGKTYAVPRSFGQTPLCYHADRVETPPDSWKALIDGRVSPACARDDAQMTALYLSVLDGFAVSDTPLSEVDSDRLHDDFVDYLQPVEGLWQTAGDAQALFRRLDPVAGGPVWRFAARQLQRSGVPVEIVQPTEGTKAWFIQFARPAGSTADTLSRSFIDAWHDWLGWETLMQPLGIAIPSEAVFERYDADVSAYGLDDLNDFVEQPPLTAETVSRCREVWTEAKRTAGLANDDE